ncbi:hypothetical protein FBQ85_26430 [Cytophagia bacterium CHB2]|nr:hypothetical protein [Cytophagia bacterium CHB2]
MAPPPPPPSDRPFRGPSEFTIQFGHNAIEDGAPAPPPPPPPEFSKNLAATGLFSVPVPEQHHAPPPPQSTGPGEFTRIMMRPATFQPPSPPPAAAPAPPPPAPGTLASVPIQNQKTWLAPLIAVLTIVVVLLFIAVIVLLLKR